MNARRADYAALLERLRAHEHIETAPRPRGPEKLASMRWLLERLGQPQAGLAVVHVAGTNGKGMTSTMIAALLRQAGHATGLYTSPHVVDLRERIVLDGQWISPALLTEVGHPVLDAAESPECPQRCSYFDLLTAMGLLAFQRAGLAWAVLETGLGGRADATNAVPKRLAVLTRIGLDHMAVLGNTLREIAGEKLGIVQPGVPTVIANQPPELMDWMTEQVRGLGSTPWLAASLRIALPQAPGEPLRLRWPDGVSLAMPVDARGVTAVKAECAATALLAAEVALGTLPLPARQAQARAALAVSLPGRLETRRHQRIQGTQAVLEEVVLDGGHNPDALHALADELARWQVRAYTLILGMQADKLVEPVRLPLARLLGHAARVLLLLPHTARSPQPGAFEAFLATVPLPAPPRMEAMPGPREALLAAAETPQRPLVVAGSFWMLGDVLQHLVPKG
ncbi:MAG TPA: hypothetical protein VL359_14220, partial [bacterium]|nr:hypothetical protein [bacterium]